MGINVSKSLSGLGSSLGSFNAGSAIGTLGGLLDSPARLRIGSTLNAAQTDISNRLASYLSSRIGQPMQQYGGERVAPMSAQEQVGQNQLGQYTGGVGAYMPQRQAAYGAALSGNAVSGINPQERLQQYYQNVNPYWQNYFQNQLAPQMKEEAYAMGGGKSSSAMNRALAQAATDVSGQMGMGAQQVYQQATSDQQARDLYNAQARQSAMQSSEPQRAEMMNNIQAAMQYGSLPRELAQAALDASFQEWLRTQPEYSPIIQQALSYLGMQTQFGYFQPQQGALSMLAQPFQTYSSIMGNLAGGTQSAASLGKLVSGGAA